MTAEVPSQNYSMISRNKTERIASNRHEFESDLSSNRHPDSIFHPEGKTGQSVYCTPPCRALLSDYPHCLNTKIPL